jgi:hypothetical protein
MNRRSIGFITFIFLVVVASVVIGTPNFSYLWYDGEIVRGTKINVALGDKLDNAQPRLATYTTVAAGATIAVPSTYGYVRITDDAGVAGNVVTVAAGTDGQMLFIFNGDAQTTVGAAIIPALTGRWGIYASGTWTFSEQSSISDFYAGKYWEATASPAAFTARYGHTSVIYGGKMWVIGGTDGTYKQDVWNSTDGITWTIATTTAAFTARYYHTSVIYSGKMWVIGGFDATYKQDVWNSGDSQ